MGCWPWGDPAGRDRVVLVGVDGTESGRAALALAAAQAAAMKAQLIGLHVPPPLPLLGGVSADMVARLPAWREEVEADAFFDTAAAADGAGVPWTFQVESGSVPTVLRRQATSLVASLVVVATGARHRGPHRCPARRLAASCEQPVLVAEPGHGEAAGSW